MAKRVPNESSVRKFYRHKIFEPLDLVRRRLTSNQRVLPNTFIIGAQKAGSTSLYNYLSEHPAFLPARKKEIHYFDRKYHLGDNYYRAHFPTQTEVASIEQEIGETPVTCDPTPCSMVHPQAIPRMAELAPDARLVAVLRNPVERTFSSYRHQIRRGRENLSFQEALDAEERRLMDEVKATRDGQDTFRYNHWHFSYVLRSHYAEQLAHVLEHYPREQVRVLHFERFAEDPETCTNEILEFLGLSPIRLKEYPALNQGTPSDWDSKIRESLCEYFEPHNEALYELLGERFDWV